MMKKTGYICFCVFLFTSENIHCKSQKKINRLHKASYFSFENKKSLDIDLGRIELLFVLGDNKLSYKFSRNKIKNGVQDIYIFPSINASGVECKKMLNELNKAYSDKYSFNIDCIGGGLKLTVTYDPKKISVESRKFVTISSNKGIELRFIDKELLDLINEKSGFSTRVSLAKKKKIYRC